MKKIILFALLITFTSACEDFEGWNIDEKHPSAVSGTYLFTHAQKELARAIQDCDVNANIFKLYAQHWNETVYTDESNYDLAGRNIGGNFWTDGYYEVLINLRAAAAEIPTDASLVGENQVANQLAA